MSQNSTYRKSNSTPIAENISYKNLNRYFFKANKTDIISPGWDTYWTWTEPKHCRYKATWTKRSTSADHCHWWSRSSCGRRWRTQSRATAPLQGRSDPRRCLSSSCRTQTTDPCTRSITALTFLVILPRSRDFPSI